MEQKQGQSWGRKKEKTLGKIQGKIKKMEDTRMSEQTDTRKEKQGRKEK